MQLMVTATCLNEGQDHNSDAEYLRPPEKDIKETLNGVPREDVLLALLDAGNDTLQEIAHSIRSVFR